MCLPTVCTNIATTFSIRDIVLVRYISILKRITTLTSQPKAPCRSRTYFKPRNSSFTDEQMPKNFYISSGESNLISPINHIRFWEKGEMAYSALKRINELKANDEFEKAKTMLADWIF